MLRPGNGYDFCFRVKTVTITEAKKHLGAYLKSAIAGQNIGIIAGHRVIALRPVDITSLDFDRTRDEEVLSKLDMEQIEELHRRIKKQRKEAKKRRKSEAGRHGRHGHEAPDDAGRGD